MVLIYVRMHGIPRALGRNAYLLGWEEVRALYVEHFSSSCFLPSPHSAFHCVLISVTGVCLVGAWELMPGGQVLSAIGAVSILELAANSGSSRMS